MIKHVVDNHPKAKPQVSEKCVTCGQEFDMVERLTEHILRQHTMLTAGGQANIAGQQLVKIWPLQESLQNQGNIKCYDCESMFSSKDLLMNHKKDKHYKKRLCNFYHKHGNCRFGDQCLNIHENSNQMNQIHGHRQPQMQSNIICRNGLQCTYKAQNRCNFKHIVESVINFSDREQSSNNTNLFHMEKLLESLGARLERIEQRVPNLQSMKDFPSVEEARAKQKTA